MLLCCLARCGVAAAHATALTAPPALRAQSDETPTTTLPPPTHPSPALCPPRRHMFFCVAVGLWGGLIIGLATEYFTSNRFTPVQVGLL